MSKIASELTVRIKFAVVEVMQLCTFAISSIKTLAYPEGPMNSAPSVRPSVCPYIRMSARPFSFDRVITFFWFFFTKWRFNKHKKVTKAFFFLRKKFYAQNGVIQEFWGRKSTLFKVFSRFFWNFIWLQALENG